MKITFATAINCIDVRTIRPLIKYINSNYAIDYVDLITEPGPNRILAENKDKVAIISIRKRIEVSINRHDSKYIFIAGHHDCAGSPVTKELQILYIKNSMDIIDSWGFAGDIKGLWIDENWEANEVGAKKET